MCPIFLCGQIPIATLVAFVLQSFTHANHPPHHPDSFRIAWQPIQQIAHHTGHKVRVGHAGHDVQPGHDVHSGHAGQPKVGAFLSPASAKNSASTAWDLCTVHSHAEIAIKDAEFAENVLCGKN